MGRILYGLIRGLTGVVLSAGVMGLAAAPVAYGQSPEPRDDAFMTRVVTAGEGKSCARTPCRVFYRMPQESGDLMLDVNGFQEGPYAPGEVVDLGSYSEPTVRIRVIGGDYPPAFVRMPGLRGGG